MPAATGNSTDGNVAGPTETTDLTVDTELPIHTVRYWLKLSLPSVVKVNCPEAGAVHSYQIDLFPVAVGSPFSVVANSLLFVTETKVPDRTSALTKSSLAGAWARQRLSARGRIFGSG